MLPGEFVSSFLLLFSFLVCVKSPNPPLSASPSSFSVSCPKVHPPTPLLSSLASLTQPFLCFSPHGSPFPASYPFNHPLSSYSPPASSMPAGLFSYPQPRLLYAPRLQYFHSQITQKCSVIVPVSAIPLSLSSLLTPPWSGPVWVSQRWKTTPLWKTSAVIHKSHFKLKIPLILDHHPHTVTQFRISFKGYSP